MDILNAVKVRLQITSTAFDALFNQLIDDVKGYLLSAGVRQGVVESERSYGAIARGVLDMWNDNAGQSKFSNTFYELVLQLKQEGADEEACNAS